MNNLTERQNAVINEAADWAIRLDNGPLPHDEQQTFAQWLRLSPEHCTEFLNAVATFEALSDIQTPARISVEELLATHAPSPIPLFGDKTQTSHAAAAPASAPPPAAPFWKNLRLMAASLFFVVFAVPGYFILNTDMSGADIAYSTVTGEQRSISLRDGSVVHLNTRTKLLVHYRDNERRIELIEGEALFKVAHDPTRPFRVYAGKAVAEAIGTSFNVYRLSEKTNIAVLEGKVAVSAKTGTSSQEKAADRKADVTLKPDAAPPTPVHMLTAGQETDISEEGVLLPVRDTQAELIATWRERRLIFENRNLAAITREFNRYNKTKIILDDPALAAIEFDGVFDADDPEAFISFLEVTANITAHRTDNNEIRLRKAANKATGI